MGGLVRSWPRVCENYLVVKDAIHNCALKHNLTATFMPKRIEFRTGDGTFNYYLAMSALLMAGLDGIKNRILPDAENGFGPYDDNVFDWPQERQDSLTSIPVSLEEALEALQDDHEYLMAGGVFNQKFIDSWIRKKMKEVIAVRNRPHPFEMNLYYSL